MQSTQYRIMQEHVSWRRIDDTSNLVDIAEQCPSKQLNICRQLFTRINMLSNPCKRFANKLTIVNRAQNNRIPDRVQSNRNDHRSMDSWDRDSEIVAEIVDIISSRDKHTNTTSSSSTSELSVTSVVDVVYDKCLSSAVSSDAHRVQLSNAKWLSSVQSNISCCIIIEDTFAAAANRWGWYLKQMEFTLYMTSFEKNIDEKTCGMIV